MALDFPGPNIILGAGRFFIDRYEENGGVRGRETYIGDTVGGTLAATVERTTIFSGDGAVATKLIDKVTQVDRTMGITPQDATLDNMALFLIASKPASMAEVSAAAVAHTVSIPSDVSERDYFQLEATAADPVGRLKFEPGTNNSVTFTSDKATANTQASQTLATADYELDYATGRFRLKKSGITKVIAAGRTVTLTIKSSALKKTGFQRVTADDQSKQVRVAVRYIEEADEGIEGRNIYIPQASVAPAGEAALKSRDTPMQFPLTLGIEQPAGDLAQVYIDGVAT